MKLFYRKYGQGPLLFILHGLFGSSDNWVSIAKSLSDAFTVILPDQRNHGQSPHSDVHDYNAMRDDLFELASDLYADKFFLAGHSMGGKTAIAFALKWPEMLNGLLVADISPFKGDNTDRTEFNHHLKILKAMMSLDLGSIRSRQEADAELQKAGLPDYVRGFVLKNLERGHGNVFRWKLNAPALLRNLEKIMEPVSRDMAFSYQVTGFPVIFLKGEKSAYLPQEDYADIKKIFPAAEFVEIKNAGHWIHSDNPEEVERNIRKLII